MAWRKSWSAQNLSPTGTKRGLTIEQRSLWDDVLDLAEMAPRTGTICIVEGVQYTDEQMAALFQVPVALVTSSLARFRELGMLRGDGAVVNWAVYQNEYQRQKPYRVKAAHKKRTRRLQARVTRKVTAPDTESESDTESERTFARFWAIYPRKENKAAAWKVWKQLAPNEELLMTIVRAVAEQQRWPQWATDGGRFIPHPASWLNGKRWEDQAPSEAALVSGGGGKVPQAVGAMSAADQARMKGLAAKVGRKA